MNENNWRADVWAFFTSAMGFWIMKTGTSKVEKIVISIVTMMVTILVIFK